MEIQWEKGEYIHDRTIHQHNLQSQDEGLPQTQRTIGKRTTMTLASKVQDETRVTRRTIIPQVACSWGRPGSKLSRNRAVPSRVLICACACESRCWSVSVALLEWFEERNGRAGEGSGDKSPKPPRSGANRPELSILLRLFVDTGTLKMMSLLPGEEIVV